MINPRETNERPIHALVIEDDMLIMLDIEEILKSMGIAKVSCCTSVEQAIRALAESRPDFALMDFHVGKSTTGDIAMTLQKLEVPFAFVTASMSPADMLPELSAALAIMKPFSENDIHNAVDFLLGHTMAKTDKEKFG